MTRTLDTALVYIDSMAARTQAAADRARDPDARVVLRAKAGSFRFLAERLRDPRPLDPGEK